MPPENFAAIRQLAEDLGVPVSELGEFGGDRISFDNPVAGATSVSVDKAAEAWRGAIRSRMSH